MYHLGYNLLIIEGHYNIEVITIVLLLRIKPNAMTIYERIFMHNKHFLMSVIVHHPQKYPKTSLT